MIVRKIEIGEIRIEFSFEELLLNIECKTKSFFFLIIIFLIIHTLIQAVTHKTKYILQISNSNFVYIGVKTFCYRCAKSVQNLIFFTPSFLCKLGFIA